MFISKKDLLQQTGISYGQLYRWKREGLIPEDWFIKQPSFTGQETFFPKEKILARIQAIQALKDRYSLEELAKILSPEVAERSFTVEDLQVIEEIAPHLIPCFCQAFDKRAFTFIEVLVLIALSRCAREVDLELGQVEQLCLGVKPSLPQVKQTDFLFVLLSRSGEYYALLQAEQAELYVDDRLKTLCQIRLNDISSQIKIKYRKRFNFRFDAEQESGELRIEGGVVQA